MVSPVYNPLRATASDVTSVPEGSGTRSREPLWRVSYTHYYGTKQVSPARDLYGRGSFGRNPRWENSRPRRARRQDWTKAQAPLANPGKHE
jgi:hypothetical protein